MLLFALQVIVTVLIAVEFRRLVYSSGFLSCYWLLYLFYSTVPIYSYKMLPHHSVIRLYIIITFSMLYYYYYSLTLVVSNFDG